MLGAKRADQVVGLGCPAGAGGQLAHPAQPAGRLPVATGVRFAQVGDDEVPQHR